MKGRVGEGEGGKEEEGDGEEEGEGKEKGTRRSIGASIYHSTTSLNFPVGTSLFAWSVTTNPTAAQLPWPSP